MNKSSHQDWKVKRNEIIADSMMLAWRMFDAYLQNKYFRPVTIWGKSKEYKA